ncbi:MAG: methyltransferase domain-containing protein [Pseudomonadota bacterium]
MSTAHTQNRNIDKEKAKAFLARFQQDLAGAMSTRLCAIGDRLGLFKSLHEDGPATSAELAARTGIQERYAREWLQGLAAAGYLDVDPAQMSYALPAEHAKPLADEDSPLFQGGILELLAHAQTPFEQLVDAFKNGGGVSQEHFHPNLYHGMSRSSGVRYKNLLLQQWLPSMPDVQAMLERGVSVVDIGCGMGSALMRMAEAFPKSSFAGIDAFAPQVEGANARARQAGLQDRLSFSVGDGAEKLPDSYDVIFTFDVIHDSPRPLEAMRNIRAHLNPGGVYVMQEITSEDETHANVGPMAAMKYGMSLHYCMTTSLAQGGAGLGTCGMPEKMVRELSKQAGFTRVVKSAACNDFISLYEIWP